MLNTTGVIVEGTTDLFWGSGHSAKQTALKHQSCWSGHNMMGQLWMKLRRTLQSSEPALAVQCFPVSEQNPSSAITPWFPDEDFLSYITISE